MKEYKQIFGQVLNFKLNIKKIICIFLLSVFFSCEEKKTEFIESKVTKGFFLIKNPPKEDSLLKKEIKLFLIKNPPISSDLSIHFYSNNSETKYFLDHLPDPGGFSSHELEDVEDYNIAKFFFIKCNNDSSKFVGELYYKGLSKKNRFIRVDTIIYKCK